MSIDFMVVFINFAAFLVALFSLYVVADSSVILVPQLKRGMLGLMWGLGVMALAFLSRVIGQVMSIPMFDAASSGVLLAGLLLLFFGVGNLFRLHKAQKPVV